MYSGSHPKDEKYAQFVSNFEFVNELYSIASRLESDGYKAKIISRCIEHDESDAYLNSGGECGSETPYYTYDVIFEVTWE